jgi:NADH-quinone oxidoreductase subunit M
MTTMPILSLIIFLPLAGALALIFVPAARVRTIRLVALGTAAAVLVLALVLFFRFDASTGGSQFVEQRAWLGYGIRYHVGIDGISLFLVALTALLMPIALLSSWGSVGTRVKEFAFFMLVLETGVLGVFVSLDLFLFYVFWEAMLIPMALIIGIWGGARRIYASVKFVLFTMFGSLLMLAAILVLQSQFHRATGIHSFAIADLCGLALDPALQTWLFLAFGLAFAVKVPMFPLHTWLPDAHVEAPTPGSVILAGILLKTGAYGFIRLALPLFPDAVARFMPGLSVLAAVGIVYGGLMALVQKDMKSLVAYSSVSHMGLVVLAVFALNAEAMEGALFQMIGHGLGTGALFLCVGVLYERTHTRRISDYGGVGRTMPVFSALFLVSLLSSLGLPGLSGFVGEILCFFGVFKANRGLAIVAVTTVILSAAYLLRLFQGVVHGPVANETVRSLKDVNARELVAIVPLVVLMIGLGLFPGLLLGKMHTSVRTYFELLRRPRPAAVMKIAPERKAPSRSVRGGDRGGRP